MAKYTLDDIIINPNSEEAKNAVGKEVYYADTSLGCIEYANKNNIYFLGILDEIQEKYYPFHIRENGEWSSIIVKKEEPYSERAKKWIEQNDLKEGDYVKVTRKVNDHEDEWQGFWSDYIDESVGKTLKVKDIDTYVYTISLENGFYYPYFVLEKTEPPKPKYVPFESKEEFIEAYHYHDNSKYSETDDILLNYGMWLWSEVDGSRKLVTEIWNAGVVIGDDKMKIINEEGHIDAFNDTTSWVKLFSEYRFLDGTPCGKESKDV